MKGPDHPGWLEVVPRRPLTREEAEAARRLAAADAALLAHLEEEQALSLALQSLPRPPVSSNFTARVLQALDREEAARTPQPATGWWHFLSRPALRAAFAGTAVLLLAAGIWRQQNAAEQGTAAAVANITGPVVLAAQAVQLPPTEILTDFDAIQQLRRSAALADGELLAALAPEDPRP